MTYIESMLLICRLLGLKGDPDELLNWVENLSDA